MPAMWHAMEVMDAARRAYVTALLDRLRRQYAERALLPSGEQMSLNLLQRLYRCVLTEHGL